MKVDTYLFGAIEVSPEKLISFPEGLVGFEQSKQYMLVHEEVAGQPRNFTLQSVDDPGLAFLIADPTTLGFNYQLALSDVENAVLGSPAQEDVVVMQVLFKKEEDGKATVVPSLRSPLIINTKLRLGLQKVMDPVQTNITLSNLLCNV